MRGKQLLILLCILQPIISKCSILHDTLNPNQIITGNQTLVSASEIFELGFFSPTNSSKSYLGIWYKSIPIQTVVWIANRDNLLPSDSSPILKIGEDQNLALITKTGNITLSSSPTNASRPDNPVIAQLFDSGNFVLRYEGNDSQESYIWQSFDYPTDSLLDGMKLGRNSVGQNLYLTSWKNSTDPHSGYFTARIDPGEYPQIVVYNGPTRVYRAQTNQVFRSSLVYKTDGVYYNGSSSNSKYYSRLMMHPSGLVQQLSWNETAGQWIIAETAGSMEDQCDSYNICGAYSTCDTKHSPICSCLKGFEQKTQETWDPFNISGGCTWIAPIDCLKKDAFVSFPSVKLPDTSMKYTTVHNIMNLTECQEACFKDCSCKAFTSTDIGRNKGCIMWSGDLIDIRSSDYGEALYVRLATSGNKKSNKNQRIVAAVSPASIFLGIFLAGSVFWFIRRKARRKGRNENKQLNESSNDSENNKLDLPTFDFLSIATATGNFSAANKLGEGGFGPVYKGNLSNGKEIAVKRLSETSGQGFNEFKNEIVLIAKLQHRNLVRLLGCCIQRHETMLIYEYMANNSLDSFIFDESRGSLINWGQRINIIKGIAQGLLYLHRDSRLRVIHRDLKASNILLDSEMNPKISDFGMARAFGSDQMEANTSRVVGTYGYMSPEYLIDGIFSVKSDAFSFGVLVLEIVTGNTNRLFEHHEHNHNLLGHAWKLWTEQKSLELIDKSIQGPLPISEILRCIHVGILCVQEDPDARLTMSEVILMLGSEGMILPEPKRPGFYNERVVSTIGVRPVDSRKLFCSNDITITGIEGR